MYKTAPGQPRGGPGDAAQAVVARFRLLSSVLSSLREPERGFEPLAPVYKTMGNDCVYLNSGGVRGASSHQAACPSIALERAGALLSSCVCRFSCCEASALPPTGRSLPSRDLLGLPR